MRNKTIRKAPLATERKPQVTTFFISLSPGVSFHFQGTVFGGSLAKLHLLALLCFALGVACRNRFSLPPSCVGISCLLFFVLPAPFSFLFLF